MRLCPAPKPLDSSRQWPRASRYRTPCTLLPSCQGAHQRGVHAVAVLHFRQTFGLGARIPQRLSGAGRVRSRRSPSLLNGSIRSFVEAADRTGGAVLIELEQKRIPVIAVVLRGPRDGHRRRGGALVAECEDRPRQSASRLHLPIAVPEASKVSASLALASSASFMRHLVQSEEAEAQAEAFAQLEASLLGEPIAGSPFDVTVAAAQPESSTCPRRRARTACL